ncbi:MAG: hypothetical protein Q7S26_02025 [bacterium]|nr:hypothetical protein [bacterium]
MAEAPSAPPSGHPYEVALFLAVILLVLGALWWVRGGPQHTSIQSMFLQGQSATSTAQQNVPQPPASYTPTTYDPPYTY